MINKIFKTFLKVDKPFGGVQIIFCGDFFQLPPVSRGSHLHSGGVGGGTDFAYNSKA